MFPAYAFTVCFCGVQEVSVRRSRSSSACLDFVMVSLLKQERTQGLSEAEARFYTACTVLALDAMHKAGYMHRCVWGVLGSGRDFRRGP